MIKRIFFLFVKIVIGAWIFSVVLVVAYRFLPVPMTPLMLIRLGEGALQGRWVGINKEWVSYEEISPAVFRAVMSGEDGKFLRHGGIDWEAVEKARKRNEQAKGKKVYGASTITMQTAKNAFLIPVRSYIRKALEAYFTYMIEFIWGKKRILEVYVNIIEMGDGIYGIEAASRTYFGKSAKDLSSQEASLIAAVLPNPRRWSPAKPTGYILKRAGFIQGRMSGMPLPK